MELVAIAKNEPLSRLCQSRNTQVTDRTNKFCIPEHVCEERMGIFSMQLN